MVWEESSPRVTSRTSAGCPRWTSARVRSRRAGRAGLGHRQRGDRVDGLGRPFPAVLAVQRPAPAHDLDGLGSVREGDARGHGRDFQGSPLSTAVPPVTLDVSGRDLAPRQPGELGMQAWLVVSRSVSTAGRIYGSDGGPPAALSPVDRADGFADYASQDRFIPRDLRNTSRSEESRIGE